MRRRRKPQEPEARLRWERGTNWNAAVDATHDDNDRPSRGLMIAVYFAALVLVAIVSSLSSCSKKNGPEPDPDAPPSPTPNVDATVEPEASPCERMCANLDALGCRGKSGRRLADDTPGGTSCVESCERLEAADGVSVNPDCQANAETCQAADLCDD